MKKILVISDTHRNMDVLHTLDGLMRESDIVVHLGDCVADIAYMRETLGANLITVRGNCDVLSGEKDEADITVEGCRIFMAHGHKYGVKSTLENIGKEALGRECGTVLYGHTHAAGVSEYCGVKLICPGSLYAPRSGVHSYAYLIAWKGKIIHKIVEI